VIGEAHVSATRRFTIAELDKGPGVTIPKGLCLNAENFAAVIRDEVGNVRWDDPLPFTVGLGKVEAWEFANTTDDTHPIHLHLVQFQILSRRNTPASIRHGSAEGPGVWKDVVQVHPGETVRVAALFEGFAGKFPMHCHILDHEDCEMMRFFTVA